MGRNMEVEELKYKKTKIYEDENLVVIFKSGYSDFLFITFGDSVSLASDLDMYADPVSTKLGYASLGFMAKSRNWYPKESMEKSIHSCRNILGKYSSRLLYGGSMGGYAAIKYSNLLKASQVITCCPQWSIDPNECEGKRNGYEKYFHSGMAGMGVTAEDVCGDIYVIHDPKHKVDSFHYSKFRRLRKGIMAVNAPYVRHHATSVIAGSKNISMMVDAVQARDPALIRRLVCNIRRKSVVRQDNLLRAASIKHPVLTAKIITSSQLRSEGAVDALTNIVSKLLSEKRNVELLTIIADVKKMAGNNDFYDELSDRVKSLISKESIKSYHGNSLIYDPLSLSIRQKNLDDELLKLGFSIPLSLIEHNGARVMVAKVRGDIFPVFALESSFVLGERLTDKTLLDRAIKAMPITDNQVCLTHNNLFLSALNTGQVRLNRDEVKEWETFIID